MTRVPVTAIEYDADGNIISVEGGGYRYTGLQLVSVDDGPTEPTLLHGGPVEWTVLNCFPEVCPVCGGDCGSTNPPVTICPMRPG